VTPQGGGTVARLGGGRGGVRPREGCQQGPPVGRACGSWRKGGHRSGSETGAGRSRRAQSGVTLAPLGRRSPGLLPREGGPRARRVGRGGDWRQKGGGRSRRMAGSRTLPRSQSGGTAAPSWRGSGGVLPRHGALSGAARTVGTVVQGNKGQAVRGAGQGAGRFCRARCGVRAAPLARRSPGHSAREAGPRARRVGQGGDWGTRAVAVRVAWRGTGRFHCAPRAVARLPRLGGGRGVVLPRHGALSGAAGMVWAVVQGNRAARQGAGGSRRAGLGGVMDRLWRRPSGVLLPRGDAPGGGQDPGRSAGPSAGAAGGTASCMGESTGGTAAGTAAGEGRRAIGGRGSASGAAAPSGRRNTIML